MTVYHSACSIGPLRVACPSVMTVHDATLLTMLPSTALPTGSTTASSALALGLVRWGHA